MEPIDPLEGVLEQARQEISDSEIDYVVITSEDSEISLSNEPDMMEKSLEYLRATIQSGAYRVLTNRSIQKGAALIYILNAPGGMLGKGIEAVAWKMLTKE